MDDPRGAISCPMCFAPQASIRNVGRHIAAKHTPQLHSIMQNTKGWEAKARSVLAGKPQAFSIPYASGILYKCPGCDQAAVRYGIAVEHIRNCEEGKMTIQLLLTKPVPTFVDGSQVHSLRPNATLPSAPSDIQASKSIIDPACPKLQPAAVDPVFPSLPVASIPPSLPPNFTHTLEGGEAIRLCVSTSAVSVMESLASASRSKFSERSKRRKILSEEEWRKLEVQEAEDDAIDAWKRVDDITDALKKAQQFVPIILTQRRSIGEPNDGRRAYKKSAEKEIRDLMDALTKAREVANMKDNQHSDAIECLKAAEAIKVSKHCSDNKVKTVGAVDESDELQSLNGDIVEEIPNALPARSTAVPFSSIGRKYPGSSPPSSTCRI